MSAHCVNYLQNKMQAYAVLVQPLEKISTSGLFKVAVTSNKNIWELYIEDEYGLLGNYNRVTDLFLLLHNLRTYQESDDYPDWCVYHNIPPEDSKWLNYFRELSRIYREMKQALGGLDPCISTFDFELGAGDFQALLKAE